jgi:D-3-phosphoglycerate dehydrogenase
VTEHRPLIVVPDGDPDGNALLRAALENSGAEHLRVEWYEDVPRSTEEWLRRTEHADAIILSWGLPAEVLRQAKQLSVISFCGTGVSDHVDLEVAAENGIMVLPVRGYGDNAVAEHALGLLFSVLMRVPEADRAVRSGEWRDDPNWESRWMPRWELKGKKVGIVGLGGIGRRFAELAAACGMEVVAWSRGAGGVDDRTGIPLLELSELFETVDVVSLHLALNDDTRQLVDADLLRSMKNHAVLINTARAGLVDTAALAAVLAEGRILGAGIDVFDTEPAAASNPLLQSDRAVLTPHSAFNTEEASVELLRLAVKNVVDHFAALSD